MDSSELVQAKERWAAEQVGAMMSPHEFQELIDFLEKRNELDLLEWIYEDGTEPLFSGDRAPGMRDWLASLPPERKAMAKKLAVAAGLGCAGDEEGLKAYLGQLQDKGVSGEVLGGYCAAWVKEHPDEAVSKFMSLRPKGVDPTGLVHVMAALPDTADFALSGGKIPPDQQKGASKSVRTALLERWSEVRPQEAANYVVGNTRSVEPDQLGVVMERWMADDPQGAAVWGSGLGAGPYRDHFLTAEAERYRKEDVGRAWEAVGRIGDLDQKIVAAKRVYEIWANRDPQGAARAWDVMFGGE